MSKSFLDDFIEGDGRQVPDQLTQLGLSRDQASEALSKIGPMILAGLKRQSESSGGEERVNHIVQKYGRESALDDLGGFVKQKSEESHFDPRLGGLLGDAGPQAADALDQKLGLSAGMGMKLIPILAPIILGALKKRANSGGSSRDGGSGGGGLLGSILDRDGDGNILDDVAGMVLGGALGSGGAQQSQGRGGLGGLLMKLLGMFFNKRR